jgi:hypothetical protein
VWDRGQRAEGRRQRTGDRGLRAEGRRQRTRVRGKRIGRGQIGSRQQIEERRKGVQD